MPKSNAVGSQSHAFEGTRRGRKRGFKALCARRLRRCDRGPPDGFSIMPKRARHVACMDDRTQGTFELREFRDVEIPTLVVEPGSANRNVDRVDRWGVAWTRLRAAARKRDAAPASRATMAAHGTRVGGTVEVEHARLVSAPAASGGRRRRTHPVFTLGAGWPGTRSRPRRTPALRHRYVGSPNPRPGAPWPRN